MRDLDTTELEFVTGGNARFDASSGGSGGVWAGEDGEGGCTPTPGG